MIFINILPLLATISVSVSWDVRKLSILLCKSKCKSYGGCTSVRYERKHLQCELIFGIGNTLVSEGKGVQIYKVRHENSLVCDENEVMVSCKKGSSVCVKVSKANYKGPEKEQNLGMKKQGEVRKEIKKPRKAPDKVKVNNEKKKTSTAPDKKNVDGDVQKPTTIPDKEKVDGDVQKPIIAPDKVKRDDDLQKPTATPDKVKMDDDVKKPTTTPDKVKVDDDVQKPTATPDKVKVDDDVQKPTTTPDKVKVDDNVQKATTTPDNVKDDGSSCIVYRLENQTFEDSSQLSSGLPGSKLIDFPVKVKTGMKLTVNGIYRKAKPYSQLTFALDPKQPTNMFSWVHVRPEWAYQNVAIQKGLSSTDYKGDFPISDPTNFTLTIELTASETKVYADCTLITSLKAISSIGECNLRNYSGLRFLLIEKADGRCAKKNSDLP